MDYYILKAREANGRNTGRFLHYFPFTHFSRLSYYRSMFLTDLQ